jgi:hypothetical protein
VINGNPIRNNTDDDNDRQRHKSLVINVSDMFAKLEERFNVLESQDILKSRLKLLDMKINV